MKTIIRRTALFLALIGLSAAAIAESIQPEISVSPLDQTVVLGDMFTIDIVIVPNGNIISGMQFELRFNDAVLDLDLADVIFGSGFDAGLLGSFATAMSSAAGVFLFEVSLEDDAVLASIQPDEFLLVTIGFSAAAIGESALELIGLLGNDGLLVTGEVGDTTVALMSINNNGSVTVEGRPVSVPEPGTGLLMLLGLACIALARRRRDPIVAI